MSAPADATRAIVALRGLGKDFPGVRALGDVSLTIAPGEILGLIGENGAGKSTLLKILGGVHAAGTYRGEVVVDGRVRTFRSTRDARDAGIAIVHQELSLVPELSVADNLLLGREPTRFGLIDAVATEAAARALLRRVAGDLAADLDVRTPVSRLGVGVQQLLEIARALADQAALVILDEPTAALTAAETARLHELVRARRAEGTAFVYVTHHLDEITALCDRVAVLRDGELVATRVVAETDAGELVSLMTGAELAAPDDAARPPRSRAAPVLVVDALSVAHPTLPARRVVDALSFTVAPGEVVALAGAMGAGRTATLSALFGIARSAVSGQVTVDGRVVRLRSPADAIAAGLALVPEDRKGAGLILGMSVADNLGLPALGRHTRFGVVDGARAEQAARARVRELHIKVPGLGADAATLSGGNQQKIVLGKWLELAPRVLLLDEPTRGVDVGAKAEIYRLIEELTARGHAVVLASSDLPEVLRLADRVLVLRDGRLVGTLDRAEATSLAIMRLAMGAQEAA